MDKKMLPTIRLSEDDLPAIKDWKVGDKHQIIIDVEQVSMRQGDEYGMGTTDKKVYATFNITSAEVEEDDSNCCDCNCNNCKNCTGSDYETEYANKRSATVD